MGNLTRVSPCGLRHTVWRRCRRYASCRWQGLVMLVRAWSISLSYVKEGGVHAPSSTMKRLYQLPRRRTCHAFLIGCMLGLAILMVGMYAFVPSGTFNMRIIPTLQEINAMFIITSASNTCDDASLPDASLPRLSDHPIPAFVQENKFTIVINTFRRTPLLLESLRHYSTMGNIDKIVVYWSNVGVEPPDLKKVVKSPVPIVVKRMTKTNLSLRFSPSETITTQAVFNVDDDLIIEEEDVQHAFNVWKYHPHGLVGFFPRTHVEFRNGNYRYYRLPLWVGNYSLILTNAAFMHKHHLSLFDERLPQDMKDFIDKWTNCEDIAMNFIVSQHCKCSGVFYVKPQHPIRDLGATQGLSRRGQHADVRDICIGMLSRMYPDVNLRWVRCRY